MPADAADEPAVDANPPAEVTVRPATARDHLGVMRVLDGANLELGADTAERRIAGGTVVVADVDNRVVGALVAVPRERGAHVEAVAVRRRRRAQGIGSALIAHAASEWRPLTAAFDRSVEPFYESLGFDCERRGDRYRGVLGETREPDERFEAAE
ncbi:GNAT family N-acetyltransferase [Halobacterium yunchengense]|uniref:GNAT family N-acetyltransferase n=1 Tax=Halobacterium yunchengense TaxID=3108497 RepID=UPI00300BE993